MNKKLVIVTTFVICLVLSFFFLSDSSLAHNYYIGRIYLQELSGERSSWTGLLFRSLPQEWGLGFNLEWVLPSKMIRDALGPDMPFAIMYSQINPGALFSYGHDFKCYAGISSIITLSEGHLYFWLDRFYTQAGVQIDIFQPISFFLQARTVVPIDRELEFRILERGSLELGFAYGF